MLYPQSQEDELAATSASLESILEDVQLGYLCKRCGGLGSTRDWQDELSLGEQQVRAVGCQSAALSYQCWRGPEATTACSSFCFSYEKA